MTEGTELLDNIDRSRFELYGSGELLGFLDYRLDGSALRLVHAETSPEQRGRGVGSELLRRVAEAVRQRGFAVLPYCPFVREWLRANPAHLDLVPPQRRREFGV
ncbi:GNAT family N-acetyltransferase [Actinopolyspora mortivallis]|uniref:GNAT family N-acetyltransferase n=1 Tax=Actinopolyspora mortivallis TaxID=33906 RepID=A0A2T0GYW5_ACTMO|nr:GNAT family N-acetyltransferase [Actinopolyspora mortivallis]PRW64299.1 GNAT family N-acetyltransferase [Actinopolyspora mortivallis]